MTMLHEARMGLSNDVGEPLAAVFGRGEAFDYFDQVRQLVQLAQTDLLFIDPYIDAEFVSRYLPHVRDTVLVRLLTAKYIQSATAPAIAALAC
jgi:hypothetical protein